MSCSMSVSSMVLRIFQAICAEYYWGEPTVKPSEGKSKLNQLIEFWWCIYRKEVGEYYISLFYQFEVKVHSLCMNLFVSVS